MRNLFIVAVVGLVLAIVACGPGAEPTPTPTSTPKVVATPTSTTVVVATPTPTPTPKPLATPTATPRPGVVATPTPTAAPLATATAAPTPKRGGITKARTTAQIASMYFLQITGAAEFIAPVYSGLLANDPLDPTSEKIVPDLADRWEISSNGLTYTFFLHRGVKWSDGVPFTAADVKYNIDLTRNPPTGFSSPRKDLYADIASVDAPDDNTVVLKMKKVSNTTLGALANTMDVIAPKHVIEKDVPHALDNIMVGTGPYLLKKFTPEGILVYDRNPNYFKPGLPYLDGIQLIPIKDINAVIAALYTGQIDSVSEGSRSDLGKTQMGRIQRERPDLVVGSAPGGSLNFFAVNAKISPFGDQRVRIALQDSLDRVALLNTSSAIGQVGGIAIPGSFWALPPEELAKLPGYAMSSDISTRRAAARQLLKDAGIAAGTEITVSAKSDSVMKTELGELIQLQLQDALPSLKFIIRNYTSAELDKREIAGELPTWFEADTPMGSDPDYFAVFYTPSGSQNYAGFSDPRIDQLQAKQSAILDPEQRRLIVWELDKLIIQQAIKVPIYYSAKPCVAWPYVKNLSCTISDGASARYEIVWLDK